VSVRSARLWLAGIVVLSASVWAVVAQRIVVPWIMVDEITYSELAKSFAAGGNFLIRERPSHAYGVVYPALIAPAWRLFPSIPDAYAAAKVINAALMSIAAVPAYLLARRVVTVRASLAVALLTVAVPSMLYTGTLMTENAFYPTFLLVAWSLVRVLDRPTALGQLGLLLLCGVAYATRPQAVVFVAAAAAAPVLLVAVERTGPKGLWPFRTLYGLLGLGVAGALVMTVARGRSPLTLLGAYRAALDSSYSLSAVSHFLVYHVAELDLYVGVVPFAALLAVWLAPREGAHAVSAFAVGSFVLTASVVAEVATFASQPSVDRIEERTMFYVTPLALVALCGLLGSGIVTRRRRPLLLAALVAGALPVLIPYSRFVGRPAVSDTFALLPWWWVHDRGISFGALRLVALGASLLAAAAFVLLPRRAAPLLVALVGLYFVATAAVVDTGRHGLRQTALDARAAGIGVERRDWLDRAVGRDASVTFLWSGRPSPYVIWENEFFNRSFDTVYDVGGDPSPGLLAERPASPLPDGTLAPTACDGCPHSDPITADYVLTDGWLDVAGTLVASSPTLGLRLYRVGGYVSVLTDVTGVYRGGTWSGDSVVYTRRACTGGKLSVVLHSDPTLFPQEQVVRATEGTTAVGSVSFGPGEEPTLTVPLHPEGSTCTVTYDVARTAIPSLIVPGSTDMRRLGTHFLRFTYSS